MMKIKSFLSGLILTGLLAMIAPSAIAQVGPAFSDVPATHPNYKAIVNLKALGVIGGYPDGTFRPEQEVNRVEALKMVIEGLEIQTPPALSTPLFTDVDLSAWYGIYLQTAYTLNMVSGYPDGTFKPAQTVNLVENLKIMLEAAKVQLASLVIADPYNDTPKTEWYAKYVQYAKVNGLIDADAENKVYPDKGMTRGNLAEALFRLRAVLEAEPEFSLKVRIENFAYTPQTLTIAKGTNVIFTNYDSEAHTVTADDDSFDSGTLEYTHSWSMKFDELGTFPYHCTFHPEMTATVVVKPPNEVPTI